MLQSVAVCCRVLQFVVRIHRLSVLAGVVNCSVLQRFVVWCIVLQYVVEWCSVLCVSYMYVTSWRSSALQCVAVRFDVLCCVFQCVATCLSVL